MIITGRRDLPARDIFISESASARDGVRNLPTTGRSTRCPSSLTLASHSSPPSSRRITSFAAAAPPMAGGRLFASGKIIFDGLVRAAARAVLLGCAPILARLSIMPQVVPKHRAIRVILSQHDQMRNHAAGCLIRSMGLAIMMEDSSWIEPNSGK
jgi:hypothetical protein